MKYEYKLVTADNDSDIRNINLYYLDKGWEVVGSVSQHISSVPDHTVHGMIVFTLRRPIPE